MKKNLLVALVSVAAVAGLASCGNPETGKSSTVTPSSTKPAEKTTITMWVSQADSPAVAKWEEGFNNANPNTPVTIKATTMEEGDVGKNYSSDPTKVPDIVHLPGDVLTKLTASASISSYSGQDIKDKIGKDIGQAALAAGANSDGVQFGLPYSANTYFLMYDKRVYTSEDKVASFDEMIKTFDAYKKDHGLNDDEKAINPQLDNGWYIQAFFMSAKGIFADNGTSATKTYLTSDGLPVARAIADLYKTGDIRQVTNQQDLTKVHAFVSGAWDYDKCKEAWGEANVGLAHLPTVKIGGKQTTLKAVGDYKFIAVSGSSKNAELAKKLAIYMDSSEGQLIRWQANSKTVVTSAKVASREDYKKGTPAIAGVMATLNNGTFAQNTSAKFDKWWDASTAFTSGVYAAVTGEKGNEKNEVSDDALKALLDSLEKACLAA